jgi:hypothetical protein
MDDQTARMDKNRKTWLSLLLNLAAGLGFSFVFIFTIARIGGGWTPIVLIAGAAMLLLGFFLSIHIHEMGHCLLGLMFGYRLISYRVGFLAWNYENGRMRFAILRNRGYGGLCAMVPPEQELRPGQAILFFSGGLLANYFTAMAALSAQGLLSLTTSSRLFLFSLGAASLFLAVTNSFPLTVGNNPTDGKILWGLIFKEPAAEKMVRIHRLTAQLAAGVRPAELALPESWPAGSVDVYDLTLLVYRYFQALDQNDANQAQMLAQQLELSTAAFPAFMQPSLYYELTFMAAVSNNPERAKHFHQKAGQILQKDEDVNGLRVKAYFAWFVQQNAREAIRLARQGIDVAALFPLAGQGKMEAELLRTLLRTIEENSPEEDLQLILNESGGSAAAESD